MDLKQKTYEANVDLEQRADEAVVQKRMDVSVETGCEAMGAASAETGEEKGVGNNIGFDLDFSQQCSSQLDRKLCRRRSHWLS